jgi:hypothetical protein
MRYEGEQKEDKLREAQLLKELIVQILEKNYSYFIAPVSSSPFSQKLATCPHPEPNQSSPLFSLCFCRIHFNIILPPNRCHTSSLFLDFPTKRSVTHACHIPNPTQNLKFLYTSKPQTSVFRASLPTKFKQSTQPYANKLVLWIPGDCNKDQIVRDCHWETDR